MAKAKQRKHDDPAESERFIETAKKFGVTDSVKAFEQAVAYVALMRTFSYPHER